MNPDLKTWLETVKTNLVPEAQKLVTEQILEHYTSAVEQYLLEEKSVEEARAKAFADLGSVQVATKKYESAFLTTKELIAFTDPRDKAIRMGYSLAGLMLLAGFVNLYRTTNAVSASGIMNSGYILSFGFYFALNTIFARHCSLKHYILSVWIFSVLLVPIMTYFVLQMWKSLPEVEQYSTYLILGLLILLIWTLIQFPKYISNWRKLSMLRETL